MYCHNENDETLVMLTLAGDQSAYGILVERYEKAAVASAIRVTGNRFMAEDAAQDAFVTAWMKLNTLREAQKFGAWVCRIARNCARNMRVRYRSFLPLDVVENLDVAEDQSQNPAELYVLSEEREQVNRAVSELPDRVRQIISMHYFDGLSIAEIADRMRISEGTVKWQLHDGRKRIRKELCAMDEKYGDTLVQRVMKKVEELKLWQLKNDKSGFAAVYRDVLREVEELPESKDKNHALADVLMRGWWWLPGKKNDALFARIADAAMAGKNEEVMSFIVTREDSKVYGGARIEFIRDKQIPRLEAAGFTRTLGREWFWLGYYLHRAGKTEEGNAAYSKVEEICGAGDVCRALVPYARRMAEILSTRYKETVEERYMIGGKVEEYRVIDGCLRYWSSQSCAEGSLVSIDWESAYVFSNASVCDGSFFAELSLGESYIGSDGTTLSYLSDSETVDTPAGRFDGCRLWELRHWSGSQKKVCRSYYKEGVGIVRQEHITDGIATVHSLAGYEIKGGDGLLPIFPGNTWEYVAEYSPDAISNELEVTVSYADDGRVLVSYWRNTERLCYDRDSWLDAVQEIANDYCCHDKNEGGEYICDVETAIERAESLAVTPMEKAHTRAAASVARRILKTDPTFNPEYTATGHWNFFTRNYARRKADSIVFTDYNPRWSFEWKHTGKMNPAEDPILYNDVLGILQDATNCIWSDEWRVGASPIVEYTCWSRDIRTEITCEDGGLVVTRAGKFDNCLKISLNIGGMNGGWSYRGGKKVYYFAEGIGVVRTENEYCGGARTAVYDLTSYSGTGEGYMPIADGLVRRYDAQGLTDGFVGAVEYAYVADSDGDIVIFADRTGIRELPPPITQYSAIADEMLESDLWREGKHAETHLLHAANNVKLMLHYFARPSWNRYNADRSADIWQFNCALIRLFGDGEVPPAWCGLYAWGSIVLAAALFRKGETERAYESLGEAAEQLQRWSSFEDGEELSVGGGLMFGGIRYIKGREQFVYPDGKREPVAYEYRIDPGASMMYGCLTAPRGWGWFNSVRSEDRFKEFVERAKKIGEMKK